MGAPTIDLDTPGTTHAVSLEHLVRYHEDGNDFLFRIVTGMKRGSTISRQNRRTASMEWKHPSSPVRKKFKTTPSAGKVLLTIFWDPKEFCCWNFWRLEPSMLRATVTPCRN
ncbi:histone-lysine N-methyltransferase SETMAR [Trichonephila clavata]|uniref:Histone-lysine N-methyltransferase SETMAR n=1 Tax=Trichonephila clavata TaxID=2740835 RepID=A0A8X6F8D0_TRICU|nr:histone-lysine N-methyltransferase SETMAR [Trichonephila clavata]